jgi:hypothetical protein
MEMSTKPGLDTPVLPDQLDEFLALLFVRVVQPAATVDNMVLLQDTKSTAIGRGMGEDEYLPSILGGVSLDEVLEPIDLSLVDCDLVGGVNGITKDGGSKSNKESFVGNLAAEVRSFLVVGAEVHF